MYTCLYWEWLAVENNNGIFGRDTTGNSHACMYCYTVSNQVLLGKEWSDVLAR